jgi:hypothetical protein
MAVTRGRVALLVMVQYHKVAPSDEWKYEIHRTRRVWCSNGHVWESHDSKVRWREKLEHHYKPPWQWKERFLTPEHCTKEGDIQAKLDEAVAKLTAKGWQVLKRR